MDRCENCDVDTTKGNRGEEYDTYCDECEHALEEEF